MCINIFVATEYTRWSLSRPEVIREQPTNDCRLVLRELLLASACGVYRERETTLSNDGITTFTWMHMDT